MSAKCLKIPVQTILTLHTKADWLEFDCMLTLFPCVEKNQLVQPSWLNIQIYRGKKRKSLKLFRFWIKNGINVMQCIENNMNQPDGGGDGDDDVITLNSYLKDVISRFWMYNLHFGQNTVTTQSSNYWSMWLWFYFSWKIFQQQKIKTVQICVKLRVCWFHQFRLHLQNQIPTVTADTLDLSWWH